MSASLASGKFAAYPSFPSPTISFPPLFAGSGSLTSEGLPAASPLSFASRTISALSASHRAKNAFSPAPPQGQQFDFSEFDE